MSYKQQVELRNKSVDKEIAKAIINEYPEDFRDTAIAKIERLLTQRDRGSASFADRALELKSDKNIFKSYLKSIIESATLEVTE